MVKKHTTVSVMGCGWLGLPLAEKLILNGFVVKGSTTKTEKIEILKEKTIQPFLLNLNPELEGNNSHSFFETDVLIINIPPKITLKGLDFHVKQIENLVKYIEKSTIKLVIFTSSTSVYPELNKEVFEEDATETAHNVLWQAEALIGLLTKPKVILRLAGLMGYDRIPAKYFAGKKGLTFAETPVNYIHRDDAIAIIHQLIESEVSSGVFNIVAPFHPKRFEVYQKNCENLGFEMPEFIASEPQNFKIVNGDKLTKILDYQFIYPNPLDFYYQTKA